MTKMNMEAKGDQDTSWFYIDSLGAQKGPIPCKVLERLLDKGLGGVSGSTLVWQPGRTEWLPMTQVDPFARIATFQSKQWYFLEQDKVQQGPISSRLLIHKLKKGDLDGLTMVYTSDMTEWQKISEVSELKDEMAKIAAEEEAAEAALNSAPHIQEEDQVYMGGDEENSIQAASREYFEQHKPKHFVADNGTRYKWDDEEKDWVVDDGVDDYNEGEEGDNIKRKLDQAEESEEEDLSDEDAPASTTDNSNKAEGDNNSNNQTGNKEKRKRRKKKKQKLPNTWIYVTGLPADVTFEELRAHFSKVGLIALSPYDQQPRIKIYREDDSEQCKGDCSICYNAEESVQLAVDILDGGYLRPNVKITVSRASFDNHQSDSKDAKQKVKLSAAQIKVARNAAKQALLWNEDDDIGVSKASALRIIVLEGMFRPEELAHDEKLSDELESDIADECSKFGTIEKVTMFTKNPKGIVVIKFSTSYAAQECIRVMNGRFFAGSQIKSYFWDGVTNYSIVPGNVLKQMEEEENLEAKRLDEFGDWLEKEQEDLPEEFRVRTE